MSTLPAACPSVETLAAFVAGVLHAGEIEQLDAHLDSCDECTRVLGAVCAATSPVSRVLEHYELLDLIGRGGMASVYRARDARTGQVVAIKRMLIPAADHTLVARYEREVDVLLRLQHPNIIGIEEYGVEDGCHYIVMEYAEGGSLRRRLDGPRWAIESALELTLSIADALARVHHQGIIHRDIKPENILIAADGTPKLADFGLARIDESLLTSGGVPGTLAYLSPEALEGQALDGRADIWSLGVVAYELLTGEHPFRRSNPAQTVGAILHHPLPNWTSWRPDLPSSVARVVLHMLEKDRSRRLASARRAAADLESALMALRIGPQSTLAASRGPSLGAGARALRRHNLRAELLAFIGRERETLALAQLVTTGATRLVTVLGPGGIGKSRLVLEVCRQLAASPPPAKMPDPFPDGVFFVELAHLDRAEQVLPAIAEAIGLPLRPDAATSAQLLAYLRPKRMLIGLDNFEHLLSHAVLVRDILEAASGVRVVATSREPLNIGAEARFLLDGMAFPSSEAGVDDREFSAIRLFVATARRRLGDFSPSVEHARQLAEICRLVDGNPLAIILAASWIGVLDPAEIASELKRGSSLLTTTARDVPARHRSVRTVCERSLELLAPEHRASFARLSVFRGGFSRTSAEVVAGADLRALSTLVNKSLVRAHTSARRYDLHELLRQHGEEQLHASADHENTKDRHAAHYAQLLATLAAGLWGPGHRAACDAIEVEIGNVRAAWSWLLERGTYDELERLTPALEEYYERRGSSAEAAALFGTAAEHLEARAEGDGRARRLLGWTRTLHGYHGKRRALDSDARGLVERALLVLDPQLEPRESGRALIVAAAIARGHEEAGSVVELGERGLALLRKAGDRWLLARALAVVGPWLYEHGRHVERAEACLSESLRLQRDMAGSVVLPISLAHYGFGRSRRGYFDEGRALLREALVLAAQQEDLWSTQRCLILLAQVERSRGDYAAALALATRNLDICQQYGAGEEMSWAHLAMAEIEVDLGRFDDARARLEACPLPPVTPELFIALIGASLADIAFANGQLAQALASCERSLAVFDRLGVAWARAAAHVRLGEIAGSSGDDAAAREHLRAGFSIAAGACRTPIVAWAAAGWAALQAGAGKDARAVEIASMLSRHHATEHATRTRLVQPLLDRLRCRCPAERFDAAVEAGRALTLEALANELQAEPAMLGSS